ncbi:nuclear transport factor 2 family protein [Paenibacillus macerans]|uniref:nuclear transport factor 2 family protein n=1 Tax=Paenibacillus macerans TaxID=44252 RepID=UPI003D31473B
MELEKLPPAIRNYVRASNKPDPAAFVKCFSDEAIVRDEGKTYVGKKEIKAWSDKYHFGANVTLEPVEAKEENGEVAVIFKVDGTFDKTGLPDPLLLTAHVAIEQDKIIRLHIF